MRKNVVQALFSASQGKFDDWRKRIHQAGQTKKEERLMYEEKKGQLLPLLIDGQKEGLSTRELEEITDINHTTISAWLKEAKEKQNNVKTTS